MTVDECITRPIQVTHLYRVYHTSKTRFEWTTQPWLAMPEDVERIGLHDCETQGCGSPFFHAHNNHDYNIWLLLNQEAGLENQEDFIDIKVKVFANANVNESGEGSQGQNSKEAPRRPGTEKRWDRKRRKIKVGL